MCFLRIFIFTISFILVLLFSWNAHLIVAFCLYRLIDYASFCVYVRTWSIWTFDIWQIFVCTHRDYASYWIYVFDGLCILLGLRFILRWSDLMQSAKQLFVHIEWLGILLRPRCKLGIVMLYGLNFAIWISLCTDRRISHLPCVYVAYLAKTCRVIYKNVVQGLHKFAMFSKPGSRHGLMRFVMINQECIGSLPVFGLNPGSC